MKKTFFNPANVRFAKKMPSRLARFGAACYREEGGDAADERVKLINEIRGMITDGTKGKVDATALTAEVEKQLTEIRSLKIEQLRSLVDDKTGALAKIEALALQMESIRTSIVSGQNGLSVRQQVEKWQKDNAEAIKGIRSKSGKQELPPLIFEVRTAADVPMTPTTVYNGSFFIARTEVQSGIVDIPRRQPVFWDFIKKGRTNAETYVWVNKTTPGGAADFIGPGVAKPKVSFKLAKEFSNAKKIAASDKVATELLQDIDGMTSYVVDELRYQVFDKLNQTLMTATADSETPAGIQSLSTVFPVDGAGLKAKNPTMRDDIRACVGYLRSGNLTGNITGFINPIDAANMDMEKATTSGVYILPPFETADGKRVGGATLIEDNNVAVGYLQIGFLDYYVIKVYQDYAVYWGWENDDFTKNLITVIGEMRLHQIFNTQHTGAFIYDTFENIATAINDEDEITP